MAENKNITPHNPLEGERPELTVNLHDGSEEQVSIIVVHKDRPEYLNICLQSIAVNSNNSNYEIVVVDNGSTRSDCGDFLDILEKDGIKVVRLPKNVYWSEACNKGVAAANKNSKYLVFLHCDVVIEAPGWLDLLINVSEAQKAGMVGVSTSNYLMQNHKIEFIEEWLMLMSRDCFKTIGPWPENLPAIGHAFLMTMRAQYKDQKPQVMRTRIAHHYKIFAMEMAEHERLTEQAQIELPKLLQSAQSRPVGG